MPKNRKAPRKNAKKPNNPAAYRQKRAQAGNAHAANRAPLPRNASANPPKKGAGLPQRSVPQRNQPAAQRPVKLPQPKKTVQNKKNVAQKNKALLKKQPKAPVRAAQPKLQPQKSPQPQKNLQPIGPVSKKARKAAANVMRERQEARSVPQRRHYRGGNYSLYFVLAGIVIIIVFVILANTVLFNCNQIEVTGTLRYSAEDIVEASGLKLGDNLLHVNEKKAGDGVLSAFAFLDKAEVKKVFPTKLVIDVTEAERWFAIVQDGKTAVVSRGGRVLGNISASDLVAVKGYEAKSLDEGQWLESEVEGKTGIPAEIFTAAENAGLSGINEIDITDRFSVKVTVDKRIVLNLGPWNGAEGKFLVAKALIEREIGEEEYITILLSNPEKAAVQSRPHGAGVKPPEQSAPVSSSDGEEPPDDPDTEPDESGDTDGEPDYDPDYDPEYDPDEEPYDDGEPEPAFAE